MSSEGSTGPTPDEVDQVARALAQARRARSRRRLLALALVLTLAGTLWLTRSRWSPLVLPSDPYEATPAANFPVGEAGLTLPLAEPVDGMSAAAVGNALRRVREALVASYLDPRMLVDHDPSRVLSLLAPDSAAAVRPRLAEGGYGTTLVRLRPPTALAATPRVSGQLGYHRVDWNGIPALDVTSNYVVAYAFTKPAGVVVIHAETHWMFPIGGALRPSSRGMYLGRTDGYWHGMDCAAAARGLTAPGPAVDRGVTSGYTDPEPLDAYFDPSRPVGITSGCR
jgi:hypothetical protein